MCGEARRRILPIPKRGVDGGVDGERRDNAAEAFSRIVDALQCCTERLLSCFEAAGEIAVHLGINCFARVRKGPRHTAGWLA
jgi:hypothetical protein